MSATAFPVCASCGKALTQIGRGRPRRTCSDACRYALRRRRQAQRSAWQAQGELAGIPDDPLTHRRRTLELVTEYLEGRPAAPPEEQLVQALTDLPQIVFILRRISSDLTPALEARAGALAEDIERALRRSFPELAA